MGKAARHMTQLAMTEANGKATNNIRRVTTQHLASVRILNISKPEARAVQPILRNDNHCANSLAA